MRPATWLLAKCLQFLVLLAVHPHESHDYVKDDSGFDVDRNLLEGRAQLGHLATAGSRL
jgi:hypothetical protein